MDYQHHIFLSYSRKDNDIMQRVRDDLRANGLSVWTDENLEVGSPAWAREIEQAISQTGCLVVLLSPDAKESVWVEREISYADAVGKRIIPILVRGNEQTAISMRLINYQWADIRQPDRYETELQKCIKHIRQHLNIVTWDVEHKYFNIGKYVCKSLIINHSGEKPYKRNLLDSQMVTPPQIPQIILDRTHTVRQTEEQKAASGLDHHFDNTTFGLYSYTHKRGVNKNEPAGLALRLWQSTYFVYLATNHTLDETYTDESGVSTTLKEKYLSSPESWKRPVGFLANGIGAHLAVITSDNYVVIVKRSEKVGANTGLYHVSCSEAVNTKDLHGKKVDLIGAAVRGTYEETSIEIERESVSFQSLIVDANLYTWNICGFARVNATVSTIRSLWKIRPPKDAYEGELEFVEFRPDTIAKFISQGGGASSWTSIGMPCLIHALEAEYGTSAVLQAFA